MSYMNEMEKLMKQMGCIESSMILVRGKSLHRMKFESNEAALAHRAKTGCGGWVLGPYVFAGTWTPSECMMHSEGVEGELK